MTPESDGIFRAMVEFDALTLNMEAKVTELKFLSLETSIPLPVEYNTYIIRCSYSGYIEPVIEWKKDDAPVRQLFMLI